ncbi:MAG: inverse autotransporter beta domain-containing protein, partial [Verrucomicrobiaceae bacterium]
MSLALASCLTAGEPAVKNPAELITPIDAWSRPLIGGGVKTSEHYTDGNFFLTAPLWSTLGTDGTLGGSYLMLEPYTSWGEQGEVVASLGLSFRHLFNDQPLSKLSGPALAGWRDEGFYLGGNVFLDMLDTQFDNRFWQLGVGLEAGSRYFEVRGNYYIPFTDRKLAKRLTETQKFKQTVTQTFGSPQVTAYGDPFAVGNSVFQDITVSAGTSARQVTTTTTVKRITDIFEEGMLGWDLEAALLLPWIDQWMDVKLLGGYFAFDNAPLGPQTGLTGTVEGFKAGIEVRPLPAIALSAMWYEDER